MGGGSTIQLSSLNSETVTRGELSQLAEYCLALKISASTQTNEATFCLIQPILLLMQVASRFLQLGYPFPFLFMVLIQCNRQQSECLFP